MNFFGTVLSANSDTVIKIDPNKIKEGVSKIFSGEIPKLEIALRGKKLSNFFENNNLNLNFDGNNKEYKFKDRKYEMFVKEKLEERGNWKIYGLTKGSIKLNPENGSQSYYFKKIINKDIIYSFDKAPGNQGAIKTLVAIEPLIKKEEIKVVKKKKEPKVEEVKVVKKKEEPKVEEAKVFKKKEEPRLTQKVANKSDWRKFDGWKNNKTQIIKVEETKVVKKKEEPKKEKTKKVVKKKGKNNLITKGDLENFLLQNILKTSSVWDGKEIMFDYQFKKNGEGRIIVDGQGIKMRWEAINGNTIKMAQVNKTGFNLFGWSEMKINYDKLVIINIQEKDPYNNGKVSKIKILSPKTFTKLEKVKTKVVKKIQEGQTIQILSLNCSGSSPVYKTTATVSTFEIDFEKNLLYVTASQNYGGTVKKYKHKDKILKYDDEKLVAFGSPYLSDEDNGEYEIEYTFFYNPQGAYKSMDFDLFGNVNNKKYEMRYRCYREYYFADNQDEGTVQTYSDPLGIPKSYNLKLSDEAFAKSFAEDQRRTKKIIEASTRKFEEQISKETKNILNNVSLKANKYGSTQLEQSQKITQAVKKEDFKKYNVDSLISYYFFESLTYYLSSLELLYKAYDNNTEAEKLNSQIKYLKSSKASEKERLNTTRQIIDDASKKIQSKINDDSLVLTNEAKKYYQESLLYAYNATDSGYKLFVVSKGLVTEVKGSTNLLGTLLKNANELKGAITVAPLVPDYVKNIAKTAKLIFTRAKVKKIKDKDNLSAALDELDLSSKSI